MRNSNSRIFGLLAAMLLTVGASAQAPTSAPQIQVDDLSTQMKTGQITLIDVRAPADYLRSHIVGAANQPYYTLTPSAPWRKDADLVLYCSGIGCSLSHDSALILMKQGYTHVRTLLGGLAEWGMKGYPVYTDPNAPSTIATQYFYPQWAVFQTVEVSATDLVNKTKTPNPNLALLDARPAAEYAAGHLPGAHNLTAEDFDAQKGTLSKIIEYVVYDRRPDRSRKLAQQLRDGGFAAHLLTGGIAVWAKSGYLLSVGPEVAK